MSNTTNYGWAYVHPTLGIGLTRGPENSITFQNSPTADIDSNGMGQASGSVDLTFDSTTKVLTLAGSAAITDTGTTTALMVKQTGTGDIFTAFDNTTEVFTILDGGNVGINKTNPGYKLEVNGDGYFETNLTVNGDLTVNGTNTIVNSTTIELDDKNIELAKGVGNDAAVNGGGITLVSTQGDKTIIYDNTADSWDFSEHVRIANGKNLLTDEVRSRDTSGLTAHALQGNLNLKATATDADIIFTVDDNETDFVALTIDGSDNGSALFTPKDGGYLRVDDAGTDGFTKIRSGRIELERNSDDPAIDAFLTFRRTRGTEGSEALVQDNDDLGTILWYGQDGGTERSHSADHQEFGIAAIIMAEADGDHGTTSGSPDTTDSPGRLVFGTTPEGADTTSTRMVIKSDGKVGIGTSTPTAELEVNGTIKATAVTVGSAELSETELEILDGATITTAELNALDGDGAGTSPTIVSTDKLILNDGGTMTQVGMDNFETYFESALDTLPNVTSVGTLTSLTVDDITIDGNNIAQSATGGDLNLKTLQADADITFSTKDGGDAVATVLTLDGSDNGSAKFTPNAGGGLSVQAAGESMKIDLNGGEITVTKADNTPAISPTLMFKRSRGTIGGETKVTDGDTLGSIGFSGWDGDSSFSAGIMAIADGDHGSGAGTGDSSDSPGKLVFKTTPDGEETLAERMVIKSDGKVGINTDTPQNRLDVKGSVAVNSVENNGSGKSLKLNKSRSATFGIVQDGDSLGKIQFYGGDGAKLVEAARIDAEVTGAPGTDDMPARLAFKTTPDGANAATEKMTILPDGKVGVGTSTPSEKLTVDAGNIQLSNGYQLQWGDSETGIFGNATSDYIRLKTAGLDRVAVDSAGNLGIGTITPQRKLHIHQASSALHYGLTIRNNQSGEGLQMGNNADGSSFINNNEATKGGLHLGGAGAAYNNGHIFISGSGKVGIGTTSPEGNLHVYTGNANIAPSPLADELVVEGAESTGISILTPNDQVGRLYFGDTDNAARAYVLYDHSIDMMKFSVASANRMVIDNAGNVGIGLPFPEAPNEKLTVQGAISFDQLAPADVPTHTAGYGKLYVKPDNCLYFKDANGAESNLILDDGFKAHRQLDGSDASIGGNTTDISLNDYFISVKTIAGGGAGTITIRLPDPTGNAGKSYVIKDVGSKATEQTVTIISAGSSVAVEGNLGGHTFASNDAAINVYTDGDNWFIF